MKSCYDSIEYYSDAEIEKWFFLYEENPNAMFLDDVGFSAWEVQREYMRRNQIRDEIDEWKGAE